MTILARCIPAAPSSGGHDADAGPLWDAMARCAGWDYHRFAAGPVAGVLMHVVADPAGLLRGDGQGAVRANVRLVRRDGVVFGAHVGASRMCLFEVLHCAGTTLIGREYDESGFLALDAVLAAALRAAGLGRATVTLEHNATLLPRPLTMPEQLAAMALQAVNVRRRARGTAALAACPPQWIERVRRACSFADPAVPAYRAARDVHAQAYCGSGRRVHGVVFDRLAVANFIEAEGGSARNRVQALQALPWLLPLMLSPESGKWAGREDILVAIDAGRPLHDAVAQAFGVPREVVRWLGRRSLPADWVLDVRRVQRLLVLLAWLAPERRPREAAQFMALTALGSTLATPLDFRRMADERAALQRIAGPMRAWLAHATRVGHAPAGAAHMATELADARDFLHALFESAQSADGLGADAADAWVLRWCAATGVARLLALSQVWHDALAETQEAETAGTGTRWPAVLAQPWHGEGRTVVELTSAPGLRAEGQQMGHCVGSYDAACRSGNSIIVSLRMPSGTPRSTAELRLVDGIPGIVVGQHRAMRNAVPDADCVRALDALLRHLNGPDQPLLARRRAFQRRQHALLANARGAAEGAQFRFGATARRLARALATPPVAAPGTLAG